MKYQLVLQFKVTSEDQLEWFHVVQEDLEAILGVEHFVDGNEVGQGNINIFIHTKYPTEALELAKEAFYESDLKALTAAYRDVGKDDYSVIWPEGSKKKFKLFESQVGRLTQTHEDAPQDADMQYLPRWARVALLGRTLRRIQPLLIVSWPEATKEFMEAVEWSIAEGELAASLAAITPSLNDAGMAAMDVYGTVPDDAITANYLAFSAARVSFAARELQASSSQFGLEQAILAVYWYERSQGAKGVKAATVLSIWKDYNHLKSLTKTEKWTNKSPVAPNVFGPMWPNGSPENWPKELRNPLATHTRRKTTRPNPEQLGLPQETIEFLRSGGIFDCDFSRCECGPITLKPLDHLRFYEFMITTEGTPARNKDPHRRENGYYALRVVDLIGECDAYDPDGLLAWFYDYNLFGAYDDDHHMAIVFPKASWADIIANPAIYLDAQWNANSMQAKYIKEPWKHCTFN